MAERYVSVSSTPLEIPAWPTPRLTLSFAPARLCHNPNSDRAFRGLRSRSSRNTFSASAGCAGTKQCATERFAHGEKPIGGLVVRKSILQRDSFFQCVNRCRRVSTRFCDLRVEWSRPRSAGSCPPLRIRIPALGEFERQRRQKLFVRRRRRRVFRWMRKPCRARNARRRRLRRGSHQAEASRARPANRGNESARPSDKREMLRHAGRHPFRLRFNIFLERLRGFARFRELSRLHRGIGEEMQIVAVVHRRIHSRRAGCSRCSSGRLQRQLRCF